MSKKHAPQDQNNSRNEYIPSYITKAPFYAEGLSDGDYLEHQRLHATPKDTLDQAKWYERGRKTGPAATKYRKGACENCGSMSHKTKECLERRRKTGAKWTGKDIQADDLQTDVKLGWDAKRDRWNGYDAREYSAVVKEYEDMEKLRQESSKKGAHASDNFDEEEEKEVAKYAEETDMGRSQPTSTRQLRLREDTAKYLLNLDLESAQYDPKTRSMDKSLSNGVSESIAEEGFVRPSATSDDAAAFERAQRYAWETQESTNPKPGNTKMLHLQANPTEGELLFKKQTDDTTAKKAAQVQALIDKYGEQPHLQNLSSTSLSSSTSRAVKPRTRTLPISSSETYAEYDKHGNPKQLTNVVPRSKYPEDILVNNHTSVFGSWWMNFQWGYTCCHSTVKNSYCTGDAGRAAFEESEDMRTGQNLLVDISTKTNANDDANKENDSVQSTRPKSGDYGKEAGGQKQDSKNGGPDRKNEKSADPYKTVDPLSHRKDSNKRSFIDTDAAANGVELEAYKRSRMAADDPVRIWGGRTGSDGLLDHKSDMP